MSGRSAGRARMCVHFSKRRFVLDPSFSHPTAYRHAQPHWGAHVLYMRFVLVLLEYTCLILSVFVHVTLDTVVLQAPSTLVLLLTIVCLGVKERMCDVMM